MRFLFWKWGGKFDLRLEETGMGSAVTISCSRREVMELQSFVVGGSGLPQTDGIVLQTASKAWKQWL